MNKTVKLTTAQALVKFLENQYISVDGKEIKFVEGVFNIFGHGNVVGLGAALETHNEGLKIIQGKNEQGMAHAAIAYAKENFRQKIYAVTSSIGPGSANMVTAAGTAMANNIPVLFLPGETFASRQPDPVLQQVEHEHDTSITTNDAFKAVSVYWDRVDRPEKLMSALIRAFEVLTNPATAGPVTISLPQDVQGEAYEYPKSFFNKRVHYIDRNSPTERALEQAVDAIKNSKRPLMIVGGGAKYSQAHEAIIKFSEEHNIPLTETQAGKSTVESGFENQLGGMGVTGTSAANIAVKDADVIIGVGTRYTDFTTASKQAFNDDAKFVNININRFQTYKLDGVQVVGDARVSLELLNQKLVDYKSEYGTSIQDLRLEWSKERERLANIEFSRENFIPEIDDDFGLERINEYADALNTELPQTNALIAINETINPESHIIGSAGSLPGDLQRIWNAKVPNTYNVEYGYSTMGYEISGALGVKLAHPDKEVYSMVGDGSFLMLHSELITAIQYGQKINVLLFDNSGYGCINNLQLEQGGASNCTEFTTHDGGILTIDYAKVAEGYGADVWRVNTVEELQQALKEAEKSTNSTLIDIKVLPKTMTDGYNSWWRVGVSEVSPKESIQKASKTMEENIDKAKKY